MIRLPFFPRHESHELDSKAISEVSYDRGPRRLLVRFRSGTLYEYGLVEPRTFREMIRSDSAGRFFVHHVRNRYPYRKLEEDSGSSAEN